MKRLLVILLAVVAVAACESRGGWVVGPGGRGAHAILVMGEDADPDSIARTDRAFSRVLNELANQLEAYGFSVYDETAVTLGGSVQGRSRRADAELIDIARSVRNPPIDTLVMFTIYADTVSRPATDRVNLRVAGRLLGVQDGRRLGSFEVTGTDNVRPDCQGGCRAEAIGKIARTLGQDVGDALAEKLAYRVPRSRPVGGDQGLARGFSLIFDDFSAEEVREIEDYLVIFTGYRSHRPTQTLARHFEYWYESSITESRLQRNLTRMFEELDMRVRINFVGNEYNMRQIRAVGSRSPRRSSEGW